MTHERESRHPQRPGERLARLLRRWWEEAGGSTDGRRPTQQALAARLGIDQTTLSRYLNPKHSSTAPPRIVEALHTHLRAPATELDLARSLSRAALEENSRQRPADPDATYAPGAVTTVGATTGTTRTTGTTDGPADRGPLFRRARPFLALAVTAVLSFAAGLYADERTAPTGRDATEVKEQAAAAGGGAVDQAREKWPLLYMKKEAADEYSWGRALQNLLKAHGYDLRADGLFGEKTHQAVMDFQQKKHLPADGKVGNRTWPELVKQVEPGSTGPAVRAVQDLLNNVGLGATAVSGEFTAATAADLQLFQRTHRLRVTGKTDRATWLALLVNQRPPVSAPDYQRPASRSPVPLA
ncbi:MULTISPECIES: peptidoglycan-binding protein [unclassified Streptomyces]|uniref:peptidoglycan-binding protein n=1 Tax=unclassified Streptomyces TaxID=2593676 RepID=UPI0024428BEE|nr:peptidoglycan-binding protein [Streptomyces sp. DH41]MDG9721668.1 peptidoglycan-binding protein [Streptomyces sp. DH41]